MMRINAIMQAWEQFFHAPTTPHTIAVFRIVWSAILLANALLLLADANRFFGPFGILSAGRYQRAFGRSRLTLFHLLPDSRWTAPGILAVHLIASCGMAVGYKSEWSCAVAFLTLLSLHQRNPAVFHSGDSLMRILTFLMIFSRAGHAFSLDEWLAGDGRSTVLSSPWCERLMQLQVCILYLRAAHWKLTGTTWIDGTAAYYPTQITAFQRLPLPRVLQKLPFVRCATWGTILVQISFGVGVWFEETRLSVLLAGVCLHLSFELLLNLQLFGLIMLSTYTLFLHPTTVMSFVSNLQLTAAPSIFLTTPVWLL